MKTLEAANELFQNDLFATKTTGIAIAAVGENYAKCVLPVDARHLNANGVIMGGAIFTLADFTFAAASNSEETNAVSLTSQITYLNPGKGSLLTAEAKCLKFGRRTCSFLISVTDETGALIAEVTTSGIRMPRKNPVPRSDG